MSPVDRSPSIRLSAWLPALMATVAAFAGVLAIFHATAVQVLSLWLHSSAHNHSFLILPIALWIIWNRRRLLATMQPKPSFVGLLLFPLFGAGWWVARSVGIAEGEQLAVACLLEATLFTVLGWRIYLALLFPFAYLMLMVPTGELLLAPLQSLSVDMVALALRVTGLPVFVDGTIIEIPVGTFVVAPGCAGLNFLLTALALSLLVANLLYRDWGKRGICVAVALAVAIATNWIRIWGILVFDQLTGGRTSIVDDHLYYGWGFFAIVMFALLWLAQLFRDSPESTPPSSIRRPTVSSARWPAFTAAAASVLLASLLPALAAAELRNDGLQSDQVVGLPEMLGPWRVADRPSTPAATRRAIYEATGRRVDLSVTAQTAASGKLTPYVDPAGHTDWPVTDSEQKNIRIGGAPVAIRAIHYTMGGHRRTVWLWYQIGDQLASSRLGLLWLQARAALTSPGTPAVAFRLSIDHDGPASDADAVLQEFVGRLDLRRIRPAGHG